MTWLSKLSQFQQFEVGDEEKQYYELTKQLIELYRMEYAIGELKRRKAANPRLQYWAGNRINYWINRLYERALPLALEASEEILYSLDEWLNFHTGTGFTEGIIGDDDAWLSGAIDDKGIVQLGGGFEFNLKDYVLEPFLRQNEWLIETWWSEEIGNLMEDMSPEEIEERGYENWNEEEIFQHVMEQIKDIYHDWFDLLKFLEHHGNINEAVARVVKQQVYPAWREFWGQRIVIAEENVMKARERLANDMESEDITALFASINLALNAQHVHGNMAQHMPLDYKTLEYLSNLETYEIDEFCNMVTGKNWKTAKGTRNWLKKTVFCNI